MRAIILAAGRGSRLQPFTADCPKCLAELGGMTLIDRQIATLRGAGIDDIVIATGYRRDMLRLAGTREVHNPRWRSTNMVETLFCAEAMFGDDMIVAYADIVYERRVLDGLLASPHAISVVVDRDWRDYWERRFDDPLEDAESLRTDGAGCIVEIGGPVADIAAIEAQYVGLMRFRDAGIAALRDAYRGLGARAAAERAYMTDLLTEMIGRGHEVRAVPVAGGWLEIDTVRDLETARAMVADGSIARFFDPEENRAG